MLNRSIPSFTEGAAVCPASGAAPAMAIISRRVIRLRILTASSVTGIGAGIGANLF